MLGVQFWIEAQVFELMSSFVVRLLSFDMKLAIQLEVYCFIVITEEFKLFSGPLCSLCELFGLVIERYCVGVFVFGSWLIRGFEHYVIIYKGWNITRVLHFILFIYWWEKKRKTEESKLVIFMMILAGDFSSFLLSQVQQHISYFSFHTIFHSNQAYPMFLPIWLFLFLFFSQFSLVIFKVRKLSCLTPLLLIWNGQSIKLWNWKRWQKVNNNKIMKQLLPFVFIHFPYTRPCFWHTFNCIDSVKKSEEDST